jgi:uncharacterized protein
MARPGRPRKHDPIADAIRSRIGDGDDDAARALIASTDIDVPDGDARTPLIWASFHHRSDLLNWLIAKGANVNHQDRNGYYALHFVGQEKLADIAAILLDAGAQTELRDIYGNTPLWTASFSARGDLSVVKLLVQHGASFENKNNAGKTVRDVAMRFFPAEFTELSQ